MAGRCGAVVPSLLLVDDHPVNLLVLRLMLERAGYSPREATSGAEAVALALAETPDLVLMDLMMPGMDGITATREILERSDGPPPTFIAVTGNTDTAVSKECLASGFAAVLHKPVDSNELFETIGQLLGRPAKAEGTHCDPGAA